MKVRVPRRIIWQIDQQIEKQRKRVTAAQQHLAELEASRSQMEPIDTEHGNNGKSRGGLRKGNFL